MLYIDIVHADGRRAECVPFRGGLLAAHHQARRIAKLLCGPGERIYRETFTEQEVGTRTSWSHRVKIRHTRSR